MIFIKAIAEAQIPCIFFCLLEGLGNPNFVVRCQLKIPDGDILLPVIPFFQ